VKTAGNPRRENIAVYRKKKETRRASHYKFISAAGACGKAKDEK
jgi:hypothetical protein